jgi:VanZ family protein
LSVLLLWAPVVLHMALIFGASSRTDPGPMPEGLSDKTVHSAVYAVLALLILRALASGRLDGITWPRILTAVALTTLYGISDELHQRFVPGRSPDVLDVAADAVGACGAAALAGVVRVVRRGRGQ